MSEDRPEARQPHTPIPGADLLADAAERIPAADLEALRLRVQSQLPDYELMESLGRGGMGAVFRARQVKLDREVAIKVLLPPPGEVEGWSERFQREAQALARLVHPGIVTVHDFGQGEDLAWIVMELVDGADLRQMLDEGRLPQAEALAIVPALCEALQYAHDQGVVHRDIKPENVLFDRFGGVKLVDFGLAKLSGDAGGLQLTRTDQAMGTPRYMAPEQLERPRDVDHRADLFSLGVVFYEMLTGHVPAGVVEPPSRVAGVDPGIDDVVLGALEREPDRRPQSAADIERGLKGIGQGAALAATGAADRGGDHRTESSDGASAGSPTGLAAGAVPASELEGEQGARPWSPPTLLGSFDVPDLVTLLAVPFSFLSVAVSQSGSLWLEMDQGGGVDVDVIERPQAVHSWALAASICMLAIPLSSVLLWAYQRRLRATSGEAPRGFLNHLPLVRVGIVACVVGVVWLLGVVALGHYPRAGSEVLAMTAILFSTTFSRRGALRPLWDSDARRMALFATWALAVTAGVMITTAGFSSWVGGEVESPFLLPPMGLLLVASVLLYRSGRMHLATVAMGAAAAITLALRTTLPQVGQQVMGLSTAEVRTIVGVTLLSILFTAAVSVTASAPRR